ncbi:helix-turn-helix transcriptional regulator [Okeanomitos corallinicola TIOX110]|uniref:Helix-turn-helix transcriptional regulator n=1 Tax=Okeanomitos corallinicola TIOX110 TaxID=3133117 RepID=A0ABZ2UTU1_9CYAN
MTENNQLRKFGEHIRTIRKAQGLSQEQLAELSGLHRNYIGGVERGERNLALLNIIRIAHALGMSPSELLKGLD